MKNAGFKNTKKSRAKAAREMTKGKRYKTRTRSEMYYSQDPKHRTSPFRAFDKSKDHETAINFLWARMPDWELIEPEPELEWPWWCETLDDSKEASLPRLVEAYSQGQDYPYKTRFVGWKNGIRLSPELNALLNKEMGS